MATAPPEKAPKPGINIYGCIAVNPYKLTIAAEELGIPYNYIDIDMANGEMKAEWYININPNGRCPAIVHVKADGTSVIVFESGACLLYLASEFDKEHKLSFPLGTEGYWTQLSWLTWQTAGYGPMLGQACYFNRYAPEPVPFAIWRYTSESRRLNHVLDKQLSSNPFVAGSRLTVADVAVFMFAHASSWVGVDINEFPHVKAWHDRLLQRPGFQRGLASPVPFAFGDKEVTSLEYVDYHKTVRSIGGNMMKNATEQWKGEPVSIPSDHANYINQ